jgi:hypothetical protein
MGNLNKIISHMFIIKDNVIINELVNIKRKNLDKNGVNNNF